MNYLLTIEYEGTRYEGWQRQKKTTQTIQGKLEQVISRMTEKEIEIDLAKAREGVSESELQLLLKNLTKTVIKTKAAPMDYKIIEL